MSLPLTLEVPASGSLYEGHFPGQPILPGVGLLHLSMRALSASGIGPDLAGISSLRLRKIVLPGDRLSIDLKVVESDRSVRFEVRRAGETVASVAVITGASADDALEPIIVGAARPVIDAPVLDALLPHRPPMRFLERVDSELEDGVICTVSIPAASALCEDRLAPALVAIEMAAQSAAAFEALRRSRTQQGAGPRIGYLVGARDVRFARARVKADTSCSATIRMSGFAPPLSTYLFTVGQDGELFASGTLSTWLTATDA